jgi:CheY-like chemotaxis protein
MRDSSKPGLLIAEDNPNLLSSLAAEARQSGRFRAVAAAGNGEQALDMFRAAVLSGQAEYVPDVVLTDLYMPKLNGIELVRQLGRYAEGRQVRSIIITSEEEEIERLAARRAGCVALLRKPRTVAELTRLLQYAAEVGAGAVLSTSLAPGAQAAAAIATSAVAASARAGLAGV